MFRQGCTCPALLFVTHTSHPFAYRAITFFGQTFQSVLLGCDVIAVNWAVPRSLAATGGISVDFFSSGYLDVSVPRVRFLHLCIQCKIPASGWVSPFGNPRIKASLQAPRGLSHATTSFIASYRLGIHHMRFNA